MKKILWDSKLLVLQFFQWQGGSCKWIVDNNNLEAGCCCLHRAHQKLPSVSKPDQFQLERIRYSWLSHQFPHAPFPEPIAEQRRLHCTRRSYKMVLSNQWKEGFLIDAFPSVCVQKGKEIFCIRPAGRKCYLCYHLLLTCCLLLLDFGCHHSMATQQKEQKQGTHEARSNIITIIVPFILPLYHPCKPSAGLIILWPTKSSACWLKAQSYPPPAQHCQRCPAPVRKPNSFTQQLSVVYPASSESLQTYTCSFAGISPRKLLGAGAGCEEG